MKPYNYLWGDNISQIKTKVFRRQYKALEKAVDFLLGFLAGVIVGFLIIKWFF